MASPLSFGNRELPLDKFTRLVTLAGPIGEDDNDPDAIFLKFERETYTRAEVLELVRIVAEMRPDECELDEADLRMWWD